MKESVKMVRSVEAIDQPTMKLMPYCALRVSGRMLVKKLPYRGPVSAFKVHRTLGYEWTDAFVRSVTGRVRFIKRQLSISLRSRIRGNSGREGE